MSEGRHSGPAVVLVLLGLVLTAVFTVYALIPEPRVIGESGLPHLIDPPEVSDRVAAGWRAFAQGDDKAATASLGAALADGAVDPLAYLILGGVHLAAGDRAAFEELLTDPAMRVGQNDASARLVRALRAGDLGDALADHVEHYPGDFLALLLLGHLEASAQGDSAAVAAALSSSAVPRAAALGAHLRGRSARSRGECETLRDLCALSLATLDTWPPARQVCEPRCP